VSLGAAIDEKTDDLFSHRPLESDNLFSCRLLTTRAVFVRFSLGVEFRLATSDYSGHGGCQIGTVELLN